jgi:hypothetical protein
MYVIAIFRLELGKAKRSLLDRPPVYVKSFDESSKNRQPTLFYFSARDLKLDTLLEGLGVDAIYNVSLGYETACTMPLWSPSARSQTSYRGCYER